MLIKLRLEQLRFLGKRDERLVRKYEGLVEVIQKVGKTLYWVQLPSWMKIHLVIHVSNLKPYHPDPDDDSRNKSFKPPVTMSNLVDKEVKEILAERTR